MPRIADRLLATNAVSVSAKHAASEAHQVPSRSDVVKAAADRRASRRSCGYCGTSSVQLWLTASEGCSDFANGCTSEASRSMVNAGCNRPPTPNRADQPDEA